MAEIIDEFYVSDSSAFLSPRFKRVLIDENGNITNTGVPGRDTMNKPCLQDYPREYRRYEQGEEITRKCNFETFTQYIVKAQDCAPFAYVQTVLNEGSCGYLEPLPEPAVPPNPFGNAEYSLYRFYNGCDIDGREYRVDISKRTCEVEAEEITLAGADPVVVSYRPEQEKNAIYRSSECILSFVVEQDYYLSELFTDDERMYKVNIYYLDGQQIFNGWIVPDTNTALFSAPPYNVQIRVTDGLGQLKNLTYPLPIGSKLDIFQSLKDILCYCLAGINLNLDLHTISNLYEVSMPNGLNDDPLAMATINPVRFSDNKGNILTCYQVLEEILKPLFAYIVQVDGVWTCVRYNELGYTNTRKRIYSYTGLFKSAEIISNRRFAGQNKEVILINHNHELTTTNAYKRVIVLSKLGEVPSIIYNGDFTYWDGHNFRGWTRYGGLDFSRVQKSIKTTSGQSVPIDDYAFRFNQEASSGKWIQAAEIDISKGDKMAFEMNIGDFNFYANSLGSFINTVTFRIRIKVGDYYLFNTPLQTNFNTAVQERGDGLSLKDYEWVQQLATVTVDFSYSNSTFIDVLNNLISFTAPECPVSGKLTIQIFGAQFYRQATRTYAPDNETLRGIYYIPEEYRPVTIDNVSINKTSQDAGRNVIDGTWFIAENYKSYYNSPDQIDVLIGDSYDALNTTQVGNSLRNGLSFIRINNGAYSTLWTEYGQSGEAKPLGMFLAKSILTAYQRPFYVLSGDFQGDNINYLNVFEVQKLEGKLFAFQGMDWSVKYKEARNCQLAEIITGSFISNDISVPHYPDQVPPPFVQNPNTDPSCCISDTVFKCPFTIEFGIPDPVLLEFTLTPAGFAGLACSLFPTSSAAYYAYSGLETGVALYSDEALTPAGNGFYSDGDFAYTVASGVITNVTVCAPTPPPVTTAYLWAKLYEVNPYSVGTAQYAEIQVKIYKGNSASVPPSFVDANLYPYNGSIIIRTEGDLVRNSAPDFTLSFSNSSSASKMGVMIVKNVSVNYHRKIEGTADRNTPKYLGFILI